jgi:hypothetical protein
MRETVGAFVGLPGGVIFGEAVTKRVGPGLELVGPGLDVTGGSELCLSKSVGGAVGIVF